MGWWHLSKSYQKAVLGGPAALWFLLRKRNASSGHASSVPRLNKPAEGAAKTECEAQHQFDRSDPRLDPGPEKKMIKMMTGKFMKLKYGL